MSKRETFLKSYSGISFCVLLTIVFITLKLRKVVNWAWIWVLAPTWISIALAVVILILVFIIALIVRAIKD